MTARDDNDAGAPSMGASDGQSDAERHRAGLDAVPGEEPLGDDRERAPGEEPLGDDRDTRTPGARADGPPGYTIVNLKRVQDMAPKFGYSPGLESRFARVPLELQESGLSYFRVAPGFRMPFGHHHSWQEEVYLVLSGSARFKLGGDVVELGPWDALRVAPATPRALEAGPGGAEILAFGAPSRGNADAEMLPGWWGE